jgi:hypothetical protein
MGGEGGLVAARYGPASHHIAREAAKAVTP